MNIYKKRKKTDLKLLNLIRNLRSRIWSVLKGKYKSKPTIKLLGCSVESNGFGNTFRK
jgi:hypothetical protein